MNGAGEIADSSTYGNSPSVADASVPTMIVDHGATPLGALGPADRGAVDRGTVDRLLASARSEGPGFNSSI